MTSERGDSGNVTMLLVALRQDPAPERLSALSEAVYPELRRLAAGLMRRERPGHTLQPTALVHEAYLSLVDTERLDWQSRAHFFGAAANAMRRILVDHARARSAQKRGGADTMVRFDESLGHGAATDVALLELDTALERFTAVDERAARVVELRVFGGLTVPEVAEVLDISRRTVDNDWAMARMWLARELGAGA
jgi:RNA polymerase sigma factor (TIGR02999 family)